MDNTEMLEKKLKKVNRIPYILFTIVAICIGVGLFLVGSFTTVLMAFVTLTDTPTQNEPLVSAGVIILGLAGMVFITALISELNNRRAAIEKALIVDLITNQQAAQMKAINNKFEKLNKDVTSLSSQLGGFNNDTGNRNRRSGGKGTG